MYIFSKVHPPTIRLHWGEKEAEKMQRNEAQRPKKTPMKPYSNSR